MLNAFTSRDEVLDEQSHVTGDSDLPRVFIRFWSDTAIWCDSTADTRRL